MIAKIKIQKKKQTKIRIKKHEGESYSKSICNHFNV